jgi:hypothetical protein
VRFMCCLRRGPFARAYTAVRRDADAGLGVAAAARPRRHAAGGAWHSVEHGRDHRGGGTVHHMVYVVAGGHLKRMVQRQSHAEAGHGQPVVLCCFGIEVAP